MPQENSVFYSRDYDYIPLEVFRNTVRVVWKKKMFLYLIELAADYIKELYVFTLEFLIISR